MKTNPPLKATIKSDPKGIQVRFAPEGESSIRVVPVRIVLDFDRLGAVIGIEIISLRHFAGENALPSARGSLTGEPVRFTYDAEADAAYLSLEDERSTDQRSVDGWLEIGADGHLLGIGAALK